MDNVTIGKNLILMPGSPIASGTVSFATGATAATIASATISAIVQPVSNYIIAVHNNATQTTIGMQANNLRNAVAYKAGNLVSYNTSVAKDTLIEGLFAGATSIVLQFSLGTALTAAEYISCDYQIWPLR